MTRLFIDADACPVTSDAIRVARARGVPVTLVGNTAQDFGRFVGRPGVDAVQVSQGRDAADFAIVERLQAGDVVVTQDIGVAAMALGRAAHAISPRGRIFHEVAIDAELAVRHAEQRHRRAGGRTTGPRPFTDEDREHFTESLERVLREAAGGQA